MNCWFKLFDTRVKNTWAMLGFGSHHDTRVYAWWEKLGVKVANDEMLIWLGVTQQDIIV